MSAPTTPANHYRGNWAPNAFNCPHGAASHSLSRTTDEDHKQSPLAPICIILGRLPSITLFSPNHGPQPLLSLGPERVPLREARHVHCTRLGCTNCIGRRMYVPGLLCKRRSRVADIASPPARRSSDLWPRPSAQAAIGEASEEGEAEAGETRQADGEGSALRPCRPVKLKNPLRAIWAGFRLCRRAPPRAAKIRAGPLRTPLPGLGVTGSSPGSNQATRQSAPQLPTIKGGGESEARHHDGNGLPRLPIIFVKGG